jgi:3'(2'), 5'-bisphosphate nucleotidase
MRVQSTSEGISVMQHSQWLDALLPICRAASEEILKVYGDETQFGVREKADKSPVTAADMAAHRIIVAQLGQLTPDIPVLSEEDAALPLTTRAGWKRFWLVDPLDGTKEFIRRNPEFTVNIALVEHGYPVLGMVAIPPTGEVFAGGMALGATKRVNWEACAESIRVRPLPDTAPLVTLASASHPSPRVARLLAQLESVRAVDCQQAGSSLKLCRVAEGAADFYPRLGPTCHWDTAAAQAVVEGAGGHVVQAGNFSRLDYTQTDTYLNPEFLVMADPQLPIWHKLMEAVDGS